MNSKLILISIFLLAVLISTLLIPHRENLKEPTLDKYSVQTKIPAIDKIGNGVILNLKVEIIPGSGKVLTNIENLLFWVDTQQSIQVAKNLAEKISKVNTSKIDIIYTISSENKTSAVEGGSAGAILTLATIAALENKELNQSIMVSGTIDEFGKIGKIGGIEAKARAAKEAGATLFLVPEGQSNEELLEPIKECDSPNFCKINYEKIKTSPLEKELNITIKEISTISDAIDYFKLI